MLHSAAMDVRPVRLDGWTIHLEPLTAAHAPVLWRQADPEIFQWVLEWPRDSSLAAFEEWMRTVVLEAPASLPFRPASPWESPAISTSAPITAAWRSAAPGSPVPTRGAG